MSGKISAATERALARIKKEKITPYRAAKLEGISLRTIYRHVSKKNKNKSKILDIANRLG